MFSFLKKNKAQQRTTNKEDDRPSNQPAPLVEGQDFYIENGFYIFTAAYHLKRGHCCGNGCRHCPYKKAENE